MYYMKIKSGVWPLSILLFYNFNKVSSICVIIGNTVMFIKKKIITNIEVYNYG